MGVNANQFGHPGAQFQRLNQTQIQQAGLVRGAVPVSPTRSSLQLSNRAAPGSFAQSRATSFASHTQAPRVNRVSFQQQQRAMQDVSHPNMVESSRVGVGNSAGGSRGLGGSATSGATSGTGASHGWSHFGEPIHGTSGSSAGNGGGWQRSENVRPGGSAGYGGSGSGQAIRISPPIVQQRSSPSYSSPNYSGPRGYSSTPEPRSSEPSSGSSRGSSSGSSSRGSSGGSSGGHTSGGHAGGGGHGGGGHGGGHR